MSEEAKRGGGMGFVLVGVAVLGSAVGVAGWHMMSNQKAPEMNLGGFDLEKVDPVRRPVASAPAAAAAPSSPMPASSIMIKGGEGYSVGDAAPQERLPEYMKKKDEDPKDSFTQAARKNEGAVRRFAEKMSRKHPVIRQYGKDWMSYPDLKKLNDEYMQNKDPIKFMKGLVKSQNFSKMVGKYATRPETREFIVQGMREAPFELTNAALDYIHKDGVAKNLVVSVIKGMGLPPAIAGMVQNNPADANKMSQEKMMGQMMQDPMLQKAMQGQAPPVNLGGQ